MPSVYRPLVVPVATTLLLALALVGSPTAVHAQNGGLQLRSSSPDSTQLKRFRLADSYMRAGQFERAISLLEDLYAENPSSATFYQKLKDAYESVKRYDDAIALVDERLQSSQTPIRVSEKARLQYLKGNEDAAFQTWDDALSIAPNRSNTYRVVYQAMVDIRRFDKAIEVLLEGRSALGRSDLFRLELAYMYSLNGEHRKAMEEYVILLDQNPERVGFVRSRLSSFMDRDDGLEASVDVLKDAVREAPLNRSYRELLAWLHMEDEDYASAFDVYRAIDRLEKEGGRVLFSFARQAADADAFDVASKAYSLILERYPDSPVAPTAQKGLGDMHRKWAEQTGERAVDGQGSRTEATHYTQAAEAYRTFLQTYPNHNGYPEVLLQLGQLQLDVFAQLGEAESTFQQVLKRFPNSASANQARYDLGRIDVMRGSLDDARLAFSRLVDRVRTGDLAEQARYELALLHFYEGEFDAALTRVEATNENTSADVANDAIELKVLLRQNKGPDSLNVPLSLYADAQLKERQRRFDDARTRLDTLLTNYGGHSLADDARFEQAKLLEKQGRTDEAVEIYGEIPLIHPQSPYADRSLFAAARLHADAGRLEDAVRSYNTLLEKYPKSLLAEDARKRLRDLWSQRG